MKDTKKSIAAFCGVFEQMKREGQQVTVDSYHFNKWRQQYPAVAKVAKEMKHD